MTRIEFATFAMALKTYYPRENLLPNEQALELWFRQLQDISYQVAEVGLHKWVALNKWSPSIADIREMASSGRFSQPFLALKMEEEVTSQGMHVALKSRKTEEMDSSLLPPAGIQTF